MTPQQKELILGALRIGEFDADLRCEQFVGIERKEKILESRLLKIRAAIKELEAMLTEVQPNGEVK